MRAPTYLASPRATSLRETFVRNILDELTKRGLVWPDDETTSRKLRGRPRYEALESLSGVPRRTLENLFNESHQPTMVGAAQLCAAIGVSLDKMLGMSGDWGMAPRSDGTTQLTCIHISKHRPDMPVCQSCFDKWMSYQRRLNELYAKSRSAATRATDDANQQQRAAVVAAGQDPDDAKR